MADKKNQNYETLRQQETHTSHFETEMLQTQASALSKLTSTPDIYRMAAALAFTLLAVYSLGGCRAGAAAADANSQQVTTAGDAEESARAEREAKRAQLRTEISDLENDRSSLSSRLETATKSAGAYQLQSENYRMAIEQQEIATKAFMMDHKAITVAIAAGIGGSKDLQDPTLSSNEHGMDGITVAIAGVFALSHMDELEQVADALVQADNHIKDLRAASEQADQRRQSAEAQVNDLQSSVAGLDQKLGELRASLGAM